MSSTSGSHEHALIIESDAFARSIASAHEWFNGFELTPFEWLEDKGKIKKSHTYSTCQHYE